MTRFEEIEQEVLGLPVAARAKLAHDIVRSMGSLSEQEIEALWVEEAERRSKEMEDSGDPGVPGAEVFARIRGRRP